MAADFPTSKPDLYSSQPVVDGTTIWEASWGNPILEELDAVIDKVGIDSSSDTNSLDYMVKHAHGFTPAAYAGEESITYPNGDIVKRAKNATPTGDVSGVPHADITFGTAFPTAVTSIKCTFVDDNNTASVLYSVSSVSTTGFTVYWRELVGIAQDMDGFYWEATGY